MYLAAALLILAGSVAAEQRSFSTIQPTGTINPAAATAVQTEYPKDHHIIKGRFVDHIWHVILDHADYDDAASNSDLQDLAQYGLTLDNYYAVESNSQANYLAMIGGDTFGLTEERFVALPANISTLVDSMEASRVLWAQYTEDQPFTAYDGWEYPAENPTYSRAKNPFVAYNSIMNDPKRIVNLRSLKSLDTDLYNHKFPQWLFIRPNLQNDGTNSDLATAAKWARDFLLPYVSDKKQYHRKLFFLSFARTSSMTGPNKVWAALLGDIHKKLKGSYDHTYYDHYSILASTQANFDLPSIGRYDCSANVFTVINDKAHQKNFKNPEITDNFNQGPYTGFLSDTNVQLPIPNLNCEGRGHAGLLRTVKKQWKHYKLGYY